MENEKIKISVVVPVYNEVKYLGKCVFSICEQTYQNLEIILVDDGSASPCRELCDSISERDTRIRVIHKENGGSLSARRRGIEEATGEYVAFVDSDDWVEAGLYQAIADMIIQKEPDMITASNYYRNYENGNALKVYDNKRTGFWKSSEFEKEVFPYFVKMDDFFDTEFPITMWAYLFKTEFARKIVPQVNEKIKTVEDYVFLMLSFLQAKSFAAISYRGYHYRWNMSSKTNTSKNMEGLLQPEYEAVNEAIDRSAYDRERLKKKNNLVMYHSLMIIDYKKIMKDTDGFLFPYSKVKKGSRILIYGAGQTGGQLYQAAKEKNEYEIVAVADKDWASYRKQGQDVIAPEEISSYAYDYIIIAISYANVKNQVKRNLIDMGIDENKIAEVDLEVLDETHLPFC